jgi:hypothetical protein
MPTIRILADGRAMYATPGQPDLQGIPCFVVGSSTVTKLTIDYTCWLLGDTLADSAWTVNGGTSGTETVTGAIVTILINSPTAPSMLADGALSMDYSGQLLVTIGHTAIASDGRAIRPVVRLVVQPAVVAPSLIQDVGVYA